MLNKINNKGFTTVEIVVSFALVVIILASMTAMVVNYRDKVTDEEVKTQLVDFKDTITKVVYDDIVDGMYTKISECSASECTGECKMCIKFSGTENNKLEIIETNGAGSIAKGIYFQYKGIKYFLPDSDLNNYGVEYMITVNNPVFSSDEENKIYGVKIPIFHDGMDENYVIQLLVNNHEVD